MSKWLTLEEKENAANELEENKKEIKQLRDRIYLLMLRNNRLSNYLRNTSKSKYGGKFAKLTDCYKLFGKPYNELDSDEKKEYFKIKQKECRENKDVK